MYRAFNAIMLIVGLFGVRSITYGQQRSDVPQMTPTDCQLAVQALSKGDLAAWPSGRKGQVEQCGIAGSRAIARAIGKTRQLSFKDSLNVMRLFWQAEQVIDAEIFKAAKTVMEDRSALPLARVASLQLLMHYYDDRLWFPPFTLKELAEGPIVCKSLGASNNTSPAKVVRALPSNAAEMVARSVETTMRQVGAPQPLRELSRCLRELMYRDVPSNLPPNALILRHDCDDRFVVTNTLDEVIPGQYVKVTLEDTVLNWELSIDPKTSRVLSLPRSGSVQIRENGKVIAEAQPTGPKCSEKLQRPKPQPTPGTP